MAYSIDRLRADLILAGRARATAQAYCDNVQRFERWAGRPVTELGEQEVRDYLLHLREVRKLAPRTYIVYHSALCFLYRHTLCRPDVVARLATPKVPKVQIIVPTVSEVRAVIACASTPFVRTMLEAAYGCGLRASEVCALQVGDIDSVHQLVHVRHGKGDKQRVVMLGDRLLQTLRDHWRLYRLKGPWLFPQYARRTGSWTDVPVDAKWISHHFRTACARAFIHRKITLHGLRHGFATHLLEAGVDTAVLRVLMGHENIATTAQYARVPTDVLRKTPSPLDLLYKS